MQPVYDERRLDTRPAPEDREIFFITSRHRDADGGGVKISDAEHAAGDISLTIELGAVEPATETGFKHVELLRYVNILDTHVHPNENERGLVRRRRMHSFLLET